MLTATTAGEERLRGGVMLAMARGEVGMYVWSDVCSDVLRAGVAAVGEHISVVR